MSGVAKNTPTLRFPEFSREWQSYKLGSLGSFKSGVGFPEKEQGGNSGTPFYKVSDMNLSGNEEEMRAANNYVDAAQIKRLKLKPITSSAMIFAKVGAAIFLERKRRAKNFLLDNNMMAFVPNSLLSLDYMSVLFANVRLSKFAQVGALPSYNASDLATIPIHLPEANEQQKIAAFLGAVDAKIGQLTRKKALLEDYKKGCMQQLFIQKLRFKDDQGNDFPDWEEKKLGDVVTFSKGKGVSKSEIVDGGALPCIRYGEIYTIYSERIDEIASRTDVPTKALTLSEPGDVIIPASGEDRLDMARACCVEVAGVALGGDINILRGADNGTFLAYYLNNAKRSDIAQRAQGISVVHLYGTQLQTIEIDVPHPDEQQKIADFLSAIDAKISLVADELSAAQDFKKGLLQQMFV